MRSPVFLAARTIALAIALATLGSRAVADPEPPKKPSVESAAADVLAAVDRKDATSLAALASRDEPDPWLVADALVGDGKIDAAEAFAKAAPATKDVERLPPWVASRRGVTDDAAARAVLKAARAMAARNEHSVVLAEIAKLGTPADDVVGVRIRALAARTPRTPPRADAWAAFLLCAEAAERIGWLARAAHELEDAAVAAFQAEEFLVARRAFEGWARLEETRGSVPGQVLALRGTANSWFRLGDAAKGLDAAERAYRLAGASKDDRLLQIAAAALGAIDFGLQRFDEAERLFEEAVELARKRADREGEAATLSNLGALHIVRGHPRAALPILAKALSLKETLGNRAEIALTCAQIGTAHMAAGDATTAVLFLERSLAIARELGSRMHEANALANLGSARRVLGEPAASIVAHERAEKLFLALGDERAASSQASDLGAALQESGDNARALDAHERALAAATRLGDKATASKARHGLAVVYASLGDHGAAAAEFERVVARASAVGDRAGEAIALSNLAVERTALGDFSGAKESGERALRMFRALGRLDNVARMQSNLGALAEREGRTLDAARLYEEALITSRAASAPREEAQALGNLALARARLGLHEAAAQDARASVELARSIGSALAEVKASTVEANVRLVAEAYRDAIDSARHAIERMEPMVSGVSQDEGGTVRAEHAAAFDVGLAAAIALGDVVEASWFLESGRSGALVESLKAAPRLMAALPMLLRDADTSARREEGAATAALRSAVESGDRARISAAHEALDRARAVRTDVVRRIQRDARATAGALYPRPDALEAVRNRLAPEEALVVYGLLPKKSVALVATRQGARLVELSGRDAVESAAAALDSSAAATAWEEPARALRAVVFDPLSLPASVKRVLVCPDGALAFVPFALLLEGRDVAFVPSGTAYGLLLEQRAVRGERIFALADPVYPAPNAAAPRPQPLAMRSGALRLTPLPATRAEAASIADVSLLGADATEAGFVAALGKQPRWRAVHLACHGICDAEHPLRSALAVTPDGDDDGFLTALDLLSIRVPADLVALSACETARGRLSRVDGVYGLSQALLVAGTPRVLSSLWKVDDEATKALMVDFYARWKAGTPSARALREAQGTVRAQARWSHPRFWAAWVLWGDPS